MFAIVRTGGKQYRVAAGDKIAVDRMAGNAGDAVSLGEALFASDGPEVKGGLTVSAEIVAQAKADKIIVFKKKRRHNYRRKAGHRQQHTILRITAIGDAPRKQAAPKKDVASKTEEAPAPAAAAPAAEAAPVKLAKTSKPATKTEAAPGPVETEAKAPKAAKAKVDKPVADEKSASAPVKKPSAKKRAE